MTNSFVRSNVAFPVAGHRLAGTLTRPTNVSRPPVILLLHGFTGSKDEGPIPGSDETMFSRTSRIWAEAGVACLAIDFRGSGESEGKFEDTTVFTQVDDAMAAIDFLRNQEDLNQEAISVVGVSLGGAVATAVAARAPNAIASLVLWNAGLNLPAAFLLLLGEETIIRGLAADDEPIQTRLRQYDKTVMLRGAFFRSLFELVPAAEITKYPGPVLVAAGSNDALVRPQPELANSFLKHHPGQSELWIRPVDHGFDTSHSMETFEALIEKTASFVAAHS